MSEKKAVHLIISGRVQGVFFRMETQRTAEHLGVGGWVKNLPNGTVEAIFEGETDKVDQAVDWCKKGPPNASVSDVAINEIDYTGGYGSFSIQ